MSIPTLETASRDYYRIEKALAYIEANTRKRPSLEEIATSANLSRHHFDRIFKRWAGITPIQFLHFLSLERTKAILARSRNLLEAALDVGLSGPGRLHDLMVTYEAVTPGQFRSLGRGLTVEVGYGPTPFGECMIAVTRNGICHLGFTVPETRKSELDLLRKRYPGAEFNENSDNATSLLPKIFRPAPDGSQRPFHLFLKGTNFQVKVWEALLTIPAGLVVSYQDVAALIGHPSAVRAAAGAVAANPVSYLIPCHRVITASGLIHRYRWGTPRKKAMLAREASAAKNTPGPMDS